MNSDKKLAGEEIVRAVIEESKKRNVEQAEAFYDSERELSIEVREGQVENLKVAKDAGLGIRVIQNGRLGYAYTTELTWGKLANTLDIALANAKAASEDSYYTLPEPALSYPELDLYDPQLDEVSLEEKIEMARQIERSGRSFDPLVCLTEQISYQEVNYEIAIANSKGVSLTSRGAFCGGVAAFVAGKDGDQQTGFSVEFVRRLKELDPDALGKEAARKAVRMI